MTDPIEKLHDVEVLVAKVYEKLKKRYELIGRDWSTFGYKDSASLAPQSRCVRKDMGR